MCRAPPSSRGRGAGVQMRLRRAFRGTNGTVCTAPMRRLTFCGRGLAKIVSNDEQPDLVHGWGFGGPSRMDRSRMSQPPASPRTGPALGAPWFALLRSVLEERAGADLTKQRTVALELEQLPYCLAGCDSAARRIVDMARDLLTSKTAVPTSEGVYFLPADKTQPLSLAWTSSLTSPVKRRTRSCHMSPEHSPARCRSVSRISPRTIAGTRLGFQNLWLPLSLTTGTLKASNSNSTATSLSTMLSCVPMLAYLLTT
jgi:hypothetical protein